DVTQMMGGTGAATLSPTSSWMSPLGLSTPSTQRAAAQVGAADAPSRARNLFVRVAAAPASGSSWTFELVVNGNQQSTLKCVITAPAKTCHSNGSLSIPHGAQVAVHATGSNITAGTTATFGWTDT